MTDTTMIEQPGTGDWHRRRQRYEALLQGDITSAEYVEMTKLDVNLRMKEDYPTLVMEPVEPVELADILPLLVVIAVAYFFFGFLVGLVA